MTNEVFHILTDTAHIVAELVYELFFLLLGVAITRWSVRREHHVLDEEHGVPSHGRHRR